MEIERRSWYLAVVNEGDGFVDSDKEEQIDLCAMLGSTSSNKRDN